MEKIREFNRSLTMPLGGYATEAEIRADARRSCQKPAEKSVRELAESSRVIQVEIRDRVNSLKSAAGTPAPVRSLESPSIARVKNGVIEGTGFMAPVREMESPGHKPEFRVYVKDGIVSGEVL